MKQIFTIAILFVLAINNVAVAQKKPIKPVKKDPDPTKTIAAYTIEALQKNDTNILIQKLMPSQANFDKLFYAIYIENPDLVKLMNLKNSRDQVQKKLITSFKKIIIEGEKQGIDWKTIKLSWTAPNLQPKKASTAFSLPIKFTTNGKEYRIIIEFCNWLNQDSYVYVLGEINWTGQVQK